MTNRRGFNEFNLTFINIKHETLTLTFAEMVTKPNKSVFLKAKI